MENEKQNAFELIETLVILNKEDVPIVYNLIKKPDKKQLIIDLIYAQVAEGKTDSYKSAIFAVNRNYDINAYVD